MALALGAAHTTKGLRDIQLSLVYPKPKQANKQVSCIEEGSFKKADERYDDIC